jgi:sulfoxide reductase catalytic subunit YedY
MEKSKERKMLIKRKRGWEIPENQATPESAYLNRRRLLVAGGAVAAAGAIATASWLNRPNGGNAQAAVSDPTLAKYPAARNPAYMVDRPITAESLNTGWNNFYEYGTSKDVAGNAQNLVARPWEVRFDGMIEKEFTTSADDLIAQMDLEERVYRHRCVEAWSMVVPWTGFPLAKLVELAKPLSSAKYLRMETFNNPGMASGQRQFWYPWPYVEGLTMAEATNELAFIVTGAYGHPVPNVMGAPLRVHLPWKYGFKSIKSIVRFSFVEERPKSFWEVLGPTEYGFWANVNPDVPHPRWSQAYEEDITTHERLPTQLFNGYGEYVASMYTGVENERLYM